MKKLVFLFFFCVPALPSVAQLKGDTVISNNPEKLRLKILYFHITHRCQTCYSIEAQLRKTIEEYFLKELVEGIIDLYIINCELPENKDLVVKYEAYGATLAFSSYLNGVEQKPEDLTAWAFQKIHKPEIFIAELKQKIENHIK